MNPDLLSAAHHEAGHAVLAHCTGHPVQKVALDWNVASGRWFGNTTIGQVPVDENILMTVPLILGEPLDARANPWAANIAIALAGFASQASHAARLLNHRAVLALGQDFDGIAAWVLADDRQALAPCVFQFDIDDEAAEVAIQAEWFSGVDRRPVRDLANELFGAPVVQRILPKVFAILRDTDVRLAITSVADALVASVRDEHGELLPEQLQQLLPRG